ncbi:hypothetical protein N7456_003557 [Penicillium angulare]|uniref:Uncharacterized protein n=1 Tax=Penicillium angulare TaxID=116970 RepID=A0A9W9FWM5_9EURO|nr:hypothetical protein N7456_003557 [Penicillium angulare]
MGWFPTQVDDDNVSWTFDIVGLLAVVGGSAIGKYAHVITASPFGSIPRLLPAPETLLNTDRPDRLPSVKDVSVCGVDNGCEVNELNFFADVIHQIHSLKPFQFQEFQITHKNGTSSGDVEKNNTKEAVIPLHRFSPLNWVTFLSILMTIALFVWAGVQHDAVAFLGIGSMSLSTSMACMSARWRPVLTVRTATGPAPAGDVVIKTRPGAFVVVKCTEEVSRELYTGTEMCDYVYTGRVHQCLLGASTICLMAGIIFFSNCSWKIQIAVGLAYIILNFTYWAMALLASPEDMWNMKDRYEVKELGNDQMKDYTQVLWKAIQATGKIEWVKKNKIAPNTRRWEGWLAEAKMKCADTDWDAGKARDEWLQRSDSDVEATLRAMHVA